MKPYVVKQGDYLEKIAHALGFEADEVWNDPKNAELKQQRDPNLLHPGDILYVPDRKLQWLPLKAGTDNLYIAKIPRTTVRLAFKDLDKPRANEPYVIHGLGEPEEGKTDADGVVEINVGVHVAEVVVRFPESDQSYQVRVGHLGPISEPSGVASRLVQLGYMRRPDASEGRSRQPAWATPEARLRRAIQAFQRANGLPPTGEVDDATRAALEEAHGS